MILNNSLSYTLLIVIIRIKIICEGYKEKYWLQNPDLNILV